MTIRNKILTGFLGMSVILTIMGLFGLHSIAESGRLVVDTFDRPLMAMSHARAAMADFYAIQGALVRMDHAETTAGIDAQADRIDDLMKDLRDDLKIARARAHSPEIVAAVDRANGFLQAWIEARRRSTLTGDAADRAAMARTETAVAQALDDLVETAAGEGFLFRKAALDSIQWNQMLTMLAVGAALVLSTVITFMLARRIVRPIKAASNVAQKIAGGDLAVDVPPAGKDETGSLLAAMRVMQLNLRQMMQREVDQRQSAQAKLVDAIESSPEAIILVDPQGNILLANSEAKRDFEIAADAMASGAPFARFIERIAETSAFAFSYQAATQAEARGDGMPHSLGEGRLADGRWLRVSQSATRDGGLITFWSDVSDLKDRESALIEARNVAQAASAAKSSFLAAMGHELRTPLNAVIGFAELIGGEMLGPVGKPEYRGYARDIEQSGRRLLAVINDILDIARSETGQLELMAEPVELARLFDRQRPEIERQCAAAGLVLEYIMPEPGQTIDIDSAKVQQIVANLVSNAVKFTPQGGTVSVMGRVRDDGEAEIVICDTGIGMRHEDIPVAMTPFAQLDNRLARRYEGTGLGLPLTRILVELHGGRMLIASQPDNGTMVTVRLPGRPADGEGAADQDNAPAPRLVASA